MLLLQRFALLGSQIMVLSVLMVFSIFIYFIEAKVQPDAFGSIEYHLVTLIRVARSGSAHPITF